MALRSPDRERAAPGGPERPGDGAAAASALAALDPWLTALLVCPQCRSELAWSALAGVCRGCRAGYPLVDGIPVLLRDHDAAAHDELDHHHGHAHGGHEHKRQQAAYFDRAEAAEFEISRPHGAPKLYGWLLREKFRRSLTGLRGREPLGVALTVCGGSGMEAEFLARAGARVIASDLSLGAARRARARASRYGAALTPIVADVEALPFRDRAIDLVYVHDGLHHLDDPAVGLREMARVAGRAVSVTEPARAAATALAVRLGLALEREEAGNRVARVTPAEVGAALRAAGLRVVRAERYAMYYPHQPGRRIAALSREPLFSVARLGWTLGNALIGRFGNKLTVQAVRPRRGPPGVAEPD